MRRLDLEYELIELSKVPIDLRYSQWHRLLGYSFFATDIDFVEFRDKAPVGLIETSTPTPRYSTPEDVLRRFLCEMRGFQFDVAWRVAHRLGVTPYAVVYSNVKAPWLPPMMQFTALKLSTFETRQFATEDFTDFLVRLPDDSEFFQKKPMELAEVVDLAKKRYPAFGKTYPRYESGSSETIWLRNLSDIETREAKGIPRPQATGMPPIRPVKGETTGQRDKTYINWRASLPGAWINIDWVEWRKERIADKLGEPVAIVKTCLLERGARELTPTDYDAALKRFIDSESRQVELWKLVSSRLRVPAFVVVHDSDILWKPDETRLLVYSLDDQSAVLLSESAYAQWITNL